MKYIILVFPIFIPLRNVCKRNQIHVRININNLMGLETFQGQLFLPCKIVWRHDNPVT